MEKRIAWRKASGRKTVPPGNLAEQAQAGFPIKDMRMIPTPTAWDGKRGPGKEYNPSSKRQSDRTLVTYAKKLPTPQARDWKDTGEYEKMKRQYEKREGPSLALLAKMESGPQTSGQLNPQWVDWLMGLPIGWSDLSCLETARSFRLSHGLEKE